MLFRTFPNGLRTKMECSDPCLDAPIYLIRHGETVWNAEGRYQGQLDSPLTSAGQTAIQRTARLMKRDITIHSIKGYVSPLGRAVATALAITQQLNLTFQQDRRLIEVTMGSWDGLMFEEIDHLLGKPESKRDDWHYRSHDGERLHEVAARVRDWWDTVSRPAVVVTHALISRLIVGLQLNLSLDRALTFPVHQQGYYRLHGNSVAYIDR